MKKIITLVIDGLGYREEEKGNAFLMANTPNFDKLWNYYPHTLLNASGTHIGLMENQAGNSEVCNKLIGAGSLLKSKINVINDAINNNEITNNPSFVELINHVKKNNSSIHLIGMVTDSGIHAHVSYIKSFIQAVKDEGLTKVYVHLITDGIDNPKNVSIKYINEIEEKLQSVGIGSIATIAGRKFAIGNRSTQMKKYYDLLMNGEGLRFNNIDKAIKACYKKEVYDDEIPPFVVNPDGIIKENDGVFWLNISSSTPYYILNAITNNDFDKFSINNPNNVKVLTIFPFENINALYLFDDISTSNNSLGRYLSALEIQQARVAESSNYQSVTTDFDGGYEKKLPNVKYYLIPSNSENIEPEMRIKEITKQAIKCMENDIDFILVNYCSIDTFTHMGDVDKTIKAIENVDKYLGELFNGAEDNFYTMFILSSHSGCEEMIDENGEIIRSSNPVPFMITDDKVKLRSGSLINVAPTILKYMDIASPSEMENSKNLFKD